MLPFPSSCVRVQGRIGCGVYIMMSNDFGRMNRVDSGRAVFVLKSFTFLSQEKMEEGRL